MAAIIFVHKTMYSNNHLQNEIKQLIEGCIRKRSYTTVQKRSKHFSCNKSYLSCKLDILCETCLRVVTCSLPNFAPRCKAIGQ